MGGSGRSSCDDSLGVGSQRVFRFPAPGAPFLKMTWVAEHTAYDPPNHFADTMIKGPFWSWNHDHNLSEVEGTTTVRDEVTYQVPFGPLGNLVDRILRGSLVKGRISRMFKARELRLQRSKRTFKILPSWKKNPSCGFFRAYWDSTCSIPRYWWP